MVEITNVENQDQLDNEDGGENEVSNHGGNSIGSEGGETGATGEQELLQTISIIRGQTDYDDETIRCKLAEHGGDMMAVIREYMMPSKVGDVGGQEVEAPSTNQKIYQEIRNYMDDINEGYTRRQAATAASASAKD